MGVKNKNRNIKGKNCVYLTHIGQLDINPNKGTDGQVWKEDNILII